MSDKERELEKKRIKAAKEKARYQAARQAGFSPKEAKSIRKTLGKRPELVQDIAQVSPTLAKGIENLTDLIRFFAAPKKTKKPPEVKFKEKKKPLTEHQKKLNREAGAFKRFLNRNPGLSQREAADKWRKMGHKLSAGRAAEIYRQKKGVPKQEEKRTRFPTYGLDTNPNAITYFKTRYNYIMEYTVLVSGTGQDETRTMTIASDKRLTKAEREKAVKDAYDEGELDQNEYYAAIYLYEDSIRTLYMVDTHKKTMKFRKFEESYLADHPGAKIGEIILEYKRNRSG